MNTQNEIIFIGGTSEECNKKLLTHRKDKDIQILSAFKIRNTCFVFTELSKKTPPIRHWPPEYTHY